jgi:hypothetical protein
MSEDWDDNITEHLLCAWYGWNMQHNPDPTIKGSYSVDVRTSTQYKNKQLHLRDLEKLSVEVAQNPEMAKWINVGELQRVRLEMMTIPTRTIMKSEEEMKADAAAAANAPPPTDVMELQLKARKLALEEAQLAFNAKQQQQREVMDHDEKMTANQARLVEAQARVAVSQNEKETEVIKLAAHSEETAAKLMSNEKINRENNQTTAFLKAIEETRKVQENTLYAKEIELKHETGSGV